MTRSIYRIQHETRGWGCTQELGYHLQPLSKTITTGQSFKASMILTSCGGAIKVSDNISWSSDDIKIATVDTKTGLVTAIAAGKTSIRPISQRNNFIDFTKIEIVVTE